jgi:ribonucleotide reductase alpha subunit
MNIKKRDETLVKYDIDKIKNALLKAFFNTNVNEPLINEILIHIDNELINRKKEIIEIEEIQDIVEKTLMLFKYFDTAKHYINYRNEHNKNRDNTSYLTKIPNNIKTKWGMLGYVTYKRTYSRRLNEDNENDDTTEEFHDTIIRVLKGSQKQLKVNFTNNELKKAYEYMMELKFSVAGRFLWQLGTETIDKLGLMSLQNCAFVKIDEPIKPFLWIFDVLMLGTGVGFNIQQENINKLPPVLDVDILITRKDTKDADFIVPDSREGWVSLMEKLLEAFFYKGVSFTYSTVLIRSAGTKIKGFGGVASGPEDLVKGINLIQGILNKKRGKKLSSIDCLDIVNIIASVVVAGNVRRCLPKGAKVHTKDGLIKIEDIIIGDNVLTSKGYAKVTNKFFQGKQNVYSIITEKGEFKGTINHKMLTYNEDTEDYIWKTIEELNIGDKLINTKTKIDGNPRIELPSFDFTNRMNRILTPKFTCEIAWLFGFIVGEFTYIDNKTILLKIKSQEQLKKVLKILENFGTSLRIITDIDINNNNYHLKIISNNFHKYITKYFTNDIPYFINETTYMNRISFITGLIESKNCIFNDDHIKFEKINNKDISILLYSCGIECKFQNKSVIIDDFTNFDYIINNDLFTGTLPNNFKTHKTYKLNNMNVGIADIKDIKLNNFVETYDIEVENVHEFFCDGFLTHNSALICMGDCDDIEYLNAKRWDKGNIPNWRCMSNNSIVCNDINNLPEEFWEGYNGNGEPYGLVNIGLSRKIGRIKDGFEKYPDPSVDGFNPCGEQTLANWEVCCLSEIFLPNINNFDELKDVATIAYRICKHSLMLNCHQKDTEKIVHKNSRIGIGITGYLQSTQEQKNWLSDLYDFIKQYDIDYSNKIGAPVSIRLTTIKPSGTLSLLAGVTSGAHPAIYQYFIRRIRISSSNTLLINLARNHNYFVEYQRNFDGTDDKNTMIIEFPCSYPEGTILAKDMGAIQQLETIKELQTNWSDNAVSVTIYYKLEELDEIKTWLRKNYNNNIKSCSFLLHNEHGFKQAPFEEITKEKYEELIKKVIPITSGKINIMKDNELSSDCVGGSCPIR